MANWWSRACQLFLSCNILNYNILYHTALHYTAIYYSALHYTEFHYIELHCTALHHTELKYNSVHYTALHSPLFWAPFLIIGRYVINRSYPVQFLLFCRVGVPIISFSSIHLVRTRPALYEKKPAYMFEMNKIIFRPHLDMSRGIFGLPGKTKNKLGQSPRKMLHRLLPAVDC